MQPEWRNRESNVCSTVCDASLMAGGMTRRIGPTLAERVGAIPPGRGDDARHCWVVDAPGHPGRWPGLLLEWRREEDGWIGRVAYAIPDLDHPGARMVERWLAAHWLSAETGPRA
jgi:hypothetical protein